MSDDLKAPKRIWASKSASGKCHVCFDIPSLEYANEYVRADLFDEAVEYLRKIAAYTHIGTHEQGIVQNAEARIACTALAELGELEGKDE